MLLTWRDLLMLGIGVGLGPALWLAIGMAVSGLRHGSWTSLDKNCDCPKDGRAPHPARVTSVPRDGLWPLRRCPVCGSRWARSYLRRVPGASTVLSWVWAAPPAYSDDEIEARWDQHEAALREREAARS